MENKQSIPSYDQNLLGNARIAREYLQAGRQGIPFAQKSLELILSDIGFDTPWVVETVTDPEVFHKTIENQLKAYERYKGDQTVGDLLDYYSNDISKYLGNNAKEARKELARFKKEKYSDVLKKIEKSNLIIEGKDHGLSSEKEAKEAKKTKDKYEKVYKTFDLLEELYSGRFRTRVEDEVTRDALRELYKPKEEREEE